MLRPSIVWAVPGTIFVVDDVGEGEAFGPEPTHRGDRPRDARERSNLGRMGDRRLGRTGQDAPPQD